MFSLKYSAWPVPCQHSGFNSSILLGGLCRRAILQEAPAAPAPTYPASPPPPGGRRCLVRSACTVSTRPRTLPTRPGHHHCASSCLEHNKDSVSNICGLKRNGKRKLGSRKMIGPGAQAAKSHQANKPLLQSRRTTDTSYRNGNRSWSWHAKPCAEHGRTGGAS